MLKRLLLCLFLLAASGPAPAAAPAPGPDVAAAAPALTLDQRIDARVRPVADAVSGAIFHAVRIGGTDEAPLMFPLIVGWLILAGLVFTAYFRFINIRGFGHGLQLIRGRYSDPSAPGEVSHFQALTSAVSGTVGLGNIAGVAVVGCTMQLGSIVDIADALLFIMAIPNLIGVYLLMPVVKRALVAYQAKLKSGEIRPYAAG